MIKAAICDNDMTMCSLLEEYLFTYGCKNCLNFEVEVFYSGKTLCRALEEGDYYHIIFMDIKLDGDMDGIEVGKYLRKTLNNYETQLVYITSIENCTLQLFDNIVLGYAQKPLTRGRIHLILDNYLKVSQTLPKVFTYIADRKKEAVSIKDIKYFMIKGRHVEIHTTLYDDEFYGCLSQIYKELKNYYFLFISKSAIINARMVKKFYYDRVEMIDGVVINISQKRRKDILKLISEYNLREETQHTKDRQKLKKMV